MIEQVRCAGVLQKKGLVNSVISANLEREKMIGTGSLARESEQKRPSNRTKKQKNSKRRHNGMVGFNYEKMKRWYELNIENSTDVLQKVATKSDIEVKN